MRLNRGIVALLATIFIWGSTYVITKSALNDIGPFTLGMVRFIIALVMLVPLAYRQGYRLRLSLQPTFFRFGLTGIALYYTLQNLGLVYTSAVNAVLVQTIIPAVTALFAVWLLKERLSRIQMMAIGVALVGTAIVGSTSEGSRSAPNPLLGNLLIVGSVVAWAIYTIQGKRLSVQYSALVTTTASIGAGLLLLLPLGLGELWFTGLPHLPLQTIAVVLYLGIVASALPMFLWNYALNYVGASAASLYLNLVPLVAVAFALLAGETVSTWQIVGGMLTLFGVWLSGRVPKKVPASEQTAVELHINVAQD